MNNTWTMAARRALEQELTRVKRAAQDSGADPDEVLEDLRRHVDEEARAAGLSVVTEEDVRRLMARVAPAWVMREAGAEGCPAGSRAPSPASSERRGPGWAWWGLMCFGVVLPLVTWGIELYSRVCAREIMDPMPTWIHVLLVVWVPVVHAVILRVAARSGAREPGEGLGGLAEAWLRRLWILNGSTVGISAAYTVLFLPLLPFAVVGIIFGLGLLALAPLSALICGLVLRARLRRAALDRRPLLGTAWWAGFAGAGVLLGALAAPGLLTHHWMAVADRAADPEVESADDPHDAVVWLRRWGNEDALLRSCYARRPGLWDGFLPAAIPSERARELYYRVTGRSFNAVPPPAGAHGRANRTWVEEFASGGAEWDTALGGDVVAGRVRGLSLQESRLDLMAQADEGWAYLEWTLEFRNVHERLQREARAQIQLPPGAVVSRLTLWVNGEEREAAFAGRAEVRAAYQKVAVVQRRDPVLVTTCGPDRILMQCFPIAPGGGTMRVRMGLSIPLQVRDPAEAVLVWPRFLERNFATARGLTHSIWLESSRSPRPTDGWSSVTDERGRTGWRASWTEAQAMEPKRRLVLPRDSAVEQSVAPDRRSPEGGWVRQRLVRDETPAPRRLALVLDGSVSMATAYREVAAALEGMPASMEVTVFLAREGVRVLYSDRGGGRVAEVVRGIEAEGGQDNVGALVQGWEWAAAKPGGALLWVHGPQAMVLQPVGAIRQRLQWRDDGSGPVLHELQVRPGPDRVVEALDGLQSVRGLARLGSVREDLDWLFAVWAGREAGWRWVREHETGAGPKTGETTSSSHVTRLWAAGEVGRLIRERRMEQATDLGSRHQLVTRATGAVVLETRQQFVEAGLHPVDPLTVPVVPEPGARTLLVVGAGVIVFLRRKRQRA